MGRGSIAVLKASGDRNPRSEDEERGHIAAWRGEEARGRAKSRSVSYLLVLFG